jgi:signal transduction histidine kinase
MARRRRHRRTLLRRPLGLRARVTLFFSAAGLLATLTLGLVSLTLARDYLLNQREEVAHRQAFVNARQVRDRLPRSTPSDLVASISTETNGYAVLVDTADNREFPKNIAFTLRSLPDDLTTTVAAAGGAAQQRFVFDGQPYLAVAVDLPAVDARYYEAFPLAGTDRALRIIATSLAIGTGVTTFAAAATGWYASRRLLRPVARVADAAAKIASGGLETRVEPESDPDLERLARSFNEMADAVQARIEREARFASDVSHELRSPITALTAAVEVLAGRRSELSERGQQALDVVVSQVRRFDQMVLDLLELSRLDAGSADMHREDVDLTDMVRRIANRYGFSNVPIDVQGEGPVVVNLDRRRLERIVANLLDNARQHAGGPVRVVVERHPGQEVRLVVEDEGPGVAPEERDHIFDRFARGSTARHRVGTGLGLALVREHTEAHGGRAWVEGRPGGGSRFVVSFDGGQA